MSAIKPIHITHEPRLSGLEKKAVKKGIEELLKTAEIGDRIKIKDFEVWRHEKGYLNKDGSLKEYHSVDWYLQEGRRTSRNRTQLKADTMLNLFITEPWQRGDQEHYDILVVHSDIYSRTYRFVVGVARETSGTVISTDKFKGLKNRAKYECIKTETIHELGHVLGLPADKSKNLHDRFLAGHCTNTCVMRQGLALPTDWINMTNDRIKYGPLCEPCETYLKEHFKETPSTGGKPKIIRYTRRR